jgi:hypothetical protein
MVETVIHTLGICGEPHPKFFDLVYIYSYIIEYKNAFAYTLNNTWQNLINYLSWQKMS